MTRRDELLEAADRAGLGDVDRRALASLTDVRQTHLTDLRRER